jgi:uncharacterized protein (TIGR00369 family)
MAETTTNELVTVDSIRERIRGSFPERLGVEPVEITDEHARGRIVVDERHLHPGGLAHGGTWVALSDTVAAWQTLRHLPPGYDFTTVEMKLNVFAAAAPGDELIATATHLHGGRSTHVIEVRIELGEKLAANLLLTQFVLPDEPGDATGTY